MKKLQKLVVVSILVLVAVAGRVSAEGSVHGKIYSNFHYDLTDGADQTMAFQVDRAYFGYKNELDEKFSVKLTLDVDGKANNGYHGIFLKVAALKWKVVKPLVLDFGLIGLHQFKDQEKAWGYRYIAKSMMDGLKYGSSADLGLHAEVTPHKMVKLFLTAINGEGYKKVQDDYGTVKLAAGAVIKPIDGLTAKVYYDMYNSGEDTLAGGADPETRSVIAAFIGYAMKDIFRVGFEYNMLTNNDFVKDDNKNGLSAYAAYIISKQLEVFARYDQANEDNGTTSTSDGALIAGLQYKPTPKVKIAPNLRLGMPDGGDTETMIYLNTEIKL